MSIERIRTARSKDELVDGLTQTAADMATLGESTLEILRQIDAKGDGLRDLSAATARLNAAAENLEATSRRQGWKHWAVLCLVAVIASWVVPAGWRAGEGFYERLTDDGETKRAAQQWNGVVQRWQQLSESDRQTLKRLLGWQ